jgi:hypothetical protein
MKALVCLLFTFMVYLFFLPVNAKCEETLVQLSSLESQEFFIDIPNKHEKISEENHQEIASATISKIQIQNKHFSMHFFLLVALCLITTVMLFAIVIKVKQRYFS